MLANIFVWLVVVAVTVGLGWLTWRAGRSRRAWARWGGRLGFGLLTLVAALIAVVGGRGLLVMYSAPAYTPATELQVAGTPEQIARGEHLATSLCAGCHSTTGTLPLGGGANVGKDSPVPIGDIISYNLTPGGPLKDWTDGEIMRVLRQGVDRDGKRLFAMATLPVRNFSDDDIAAVIAYLRSQPALPDPPKQGDYPNFLLALFVGANLVPQAPPPVTGVITAPPKAATADYGRYVLSYNDCSTCHGADYTGGTPGGLTPVGPSLRVVLGWTQAEFITTLRTGVDPSGHALDASKMPWKVFGQMDDDELGGIYAYLHGLPAVASVP
jgi:mono/diheme cytochrome c family protein